MRKCVDMRAGNVMEGFVSALHYSNNITHMSLPWEQQNTLEDLQSSYEQAMDSGKVLKAKDIWDKAKGLGHQVEARPQDSELLKKEIKRVDKVISEMDKLLSQYE